MACELELERTVEEYGTVFLTVIGPPERVDPSFAPRGFPREGKGTLPKKANEALIAMFSPEQVRAGTTSFKVDMVSERIFDSEETECVFVLEYRVCRYQRNYDLVINGEVFDPDDPDAPPKRVSAKIFSHQGVGLERVRQEVIGICYDKLLEFILSGARSAVPVPPLVPLVAGRGPNEANALLAALIGPIGDRSAEGKAAPITPSRISLRAAAAILNPIGINVNELDSLRGGSGTLNEVANEIDAITTEESGAVAAVLRELAKAPIVVRGGVSEDDALISLAVSLLAP